MLTGNFTAMALLAMGVSNCCAAAAAAQQHTHNANFTDVRHAHGAHIEAPVGVMAMHQHRKGQWMVSYRYMSMSMDGNRSGSTSLSPTEIATTVPNRFFGMPMQPPTLRVVPTTMTMDMHMLGVMYAPSDSVTLMLMLNYFDKNMEHVTFQGPMGAQTLGRFSTRSSGMGDTQLSASIRLKNSGAWRLLGLVGLSLPTGDIEQSGQVLAPTGMRPNLRLPYPMQLGSGTYDPVVGPALAGNARRAAWGVSWRGVLRFGRNDAHYSLGDEHVVSGWLSYPVSPWLESSLRLEVTDRDTIDGIDPLILAPVQTADPERLGGTAVNAAFGLNLFATSQHGVGLEYQVPLYTHVEGPQLEPDSRLVLGYQYAF